jgi:hypothetical protein
LLSSSFKIGPLIVTDIGSWILGSLLHIYLCLTSFGGRERAVLGGLNSGPHN